MSYSNLCKVVSRATISKKLYSTGRLEDSGRQNDEKMWRKTVHSQSYGASFPHSAILSVAVVLLRKLPITGTRKRQTATPANKINS